MTIERTIDEKICRALVALINGDDDLGAYYQQRARYLPPTVDPEMLVLPDVYVQNALDRDTLNRLTGNAVNPTVNVRIVLVEPDRVSPYDESEPPEANIINRIVAMERLIEKGQDIVGDGVDIAKLVDPDADPGAPPAQRLLNTNAPKIVRQQRVRVDISPAGDRSSIAVLFPLLVTYETRQDRLTRRGR